MGSSAFVPKPAWEASSKGGFIVGAKIRTEELIYVLARQVIPPEDISNLPAPEIGVRMIQIDLAQPEGKRKTPMKDARGHTSPVPGVSRWPVAQDLLISASRDGAAATARKPRGFRHGASNASTAMPMPSAAAARFSRIGNSTA